MGYSLKDNVDVFRVRAHREKVFKFAISESWKTYDFLRNSLDQTDFFSEGQLTENLIV